MCIQHWLSVNAYSNVCVQMQSEEGTEWLLELLTDVQLQQYFLRIRDELNVTRISHFDYVKNEDLEKIGMGRPGTSYHHLFPDAIEVFRGKTISI